MTGRVIRSNNNEIMDVVLAYQLFKTVLKIPGVGVAKLHQSQLHAIEISGMLRSTIRISLRIGGWHGEAVVYGDYRPINGNVRTATECDLAGKVIFTEYQRDTFGSNRLLPHQLKDAAGWWPGLDNWTNNSEGNNNGE